MISLEEYAKICNLISSCNDIINGKFILAHHKINALLKSLTDSKEVYTLLASTLNNFNFEREFSRAQFRTAKDKRSFVVPDEDEKLLPFVFCILVSINNKNLDLDTFLSEFFASESGNRAEEFKNFAQKLILPFRTAIATHFNIPQAGVSTMITQPLQNKEKEEELKTRAEELKKSAEVDETFFENEEEETEEIDEDMSYPEMTAEKLQHFFDEIKANCLQILSELPYEKRLKSDAMADVEYIAETIVYNCENSDLKNTIALITALDYIVAKSKSLKIYSRELKNILINLYEDESDDEEDED